MNISAPFIARPAATTLLTIAITLAGLFSFFQLPVSPLNSQKKAPPRPWFLAKVIFVAMVACVS